MNRISQNSSPVPLLQSLHWVYGISDVPNNIANLSDDQNDRVAYAAAHTAIIYDKHSGTQTFLQVWAHTMPGLA